MENECVDYLMCANNTKCYRCANGNLYKVHKQKSNYISKKTTNSKSESWEHLEQDVANALKKIPSDEEVRRSRMSGALPFEKGDVLDSILHIECKERSGIEIKQGKDKTFPMHRSWLEKAKQEALELDKPMMLAFRFKDDKNIYSVISFDELAELVTELKACKMHLKKLTVINNNK